MGKVAILTLMGRFNYGNRLQNYASEYMFRTMGYEPVTLNSVRPPYQELAAKAIRRLKGWETSKEAIQNPRYNAFRSFDELMNIENVPLCSKSLVSEYDFFSVGSDQVWNLNLMSHRTRWFFLDFVPKEKRVALAPSIGLDHLTYAQAKRLAKGVNNFPLLSVREKRGAELIKQCSGRAVEVICDPALAVPVSEWRKIKSNKLTPTTPYIFAYLLGDDNPEAHAALDYLTRELNAPILSLTDRSASADLPAGPAEFLSLIDGACHVVTDSFHASLFSAIFETPLTILHRQGDAGTFSRLDNLATILHLDNKIFGTPGFDYSLSNDFSDTHSLIRKEADRCIRYLEACLAFYPDCENRQPYSSIASL